MILPAAGLDGLQFLDVQQPGPLVDHLLKMPQGQPLPGSHVNENIPLLPVPHTAAFRWYCRSALWSWVINIHLFQKKE